MQEIGLSIYMMVIGCSMVICGIIGLVYNSYRYVYLLGKRRGWDKCFKTLEEINTKDWSKINDNDREKY